MPPNSAVNRTPRKRVAGYLGSWAPARAFKLSPGRRPHRGKFGR